MRTELQPIYNNQKSFGSKAYVLTSDTNQSKTLYSYDTKVASIVEVETNDKCYTIKAEVYNLQSATTLKHVKEFLTQNNFKAVNKSQIEKDYWVSL